MGVIPGKLGVAQVMDFRRLPEVLLDLDQAVSDGDSNFCCNRPSFFFFGLLRDSCEIAVTDDGDAEYEPLGYPINLTSRGTK